MNCRRLVLGAGAIAIVASFAPARAEAGIIITREGKVIIGRILKDEITQEGVRVHWPYKDRREHGTFFFPMNLIRWYDPEADEPSAAYWDEHGNEPIDQQYLAMRDRYLDAKQKSKLDPNMKLFLDSLRSGPQVRLSPLSIPFDQGRVTIRKPEGWQRDEQQGVLMLISDTKGTEGMTPRIHIYSIPTIAIQPSEAVQLYRAELAKIAGQEASRPDAIEFKDEDPVPRTVTGGFDYSVTTTMRKQGSQPITVLRQVFFRDNRTYFYQAYAHEKDYEKLAIFFRMCLQSMQINDGGGGGGAPKPSASASDAPKPSDAPGGSPAPKSGG